MQFKKIAVLGLSAVCLFSCGKTVSAADAKKFVEDNYSSKTVIAPKKINVTFDATKTTGTEYKITAEIMLLGLANNLGVTYEKDSYKISVDLTSTDKGWDSYIGVHNYVLSKDSPIFDNDVGATYITNGKELTISFVDENEKDNFVKTTFNENGQCRSLESSTKSASIAGAEGCLYYTTKETATF